MKKLLNLPFLILIIAVVVSCEKETELVEIPEATIARIANAAAAAVSTPSTAEIAAAVEAALLDDLQEEVEEATAEIMHSGFITSDETWEASSIHVLQNK